MIGPNDLDIPFDVDDVQRTIEILEDQIRRIEANNDRDNTFNQINRMLIDIYRRNEGFFPPLHMKPPQSRR